MARTGHAEVIRIEFDPELISFRDLLRFSGHSRPDDAQSPGQRCRHAVSLGNILCR